MDTPLIASKWSLPRARPARVRRARPGKNLDAAWRMPVTLVAAPAGFGKTTLVAAWCAEQSRPVAWLSLDPGDNDSVRFFSYLTASLQTLDPLLGRTAPALASDPAAAFASLVNDLNTDIGEAALVLDDFHLLENKELLQGFAGWIEHIPPTFHIILATRVDPPLPIARWRARHQLLELRAAELRFNLAETAEFLNVAMGLDLSPDLVAQLETRTEGWIAGLQLAALALQGRTDPTSFVESFAGNHRYIIGYLLEEVLERESEEIQDFLEQTAILDRMCGGLCDAVTGRDDGARKLAFLEKQNLFVTALDDGGNWYRYHRLFADVLQNKLVRRTDHAPAELHRRAAKWFAQNQLYPEAIGHALRAGDFESAAQWIETVAVQLLASGGGQIATVTGWLNALPAELKATRPRLRLTEAWALMGRAPAAAVEVPLRQAVALIAQEPAADLRLVRGEVAALRTLLYGFLYEDMRALAFAHEALDLLPSDAFYVRTLVQQALGYVELVAGNLGEVEQALLPAREIARGDPNLLLAEITILATLGLARGEQGKLTEAVRLHEEARELVEREGHPLPLQSSVLVYIDLALYLYEQNELAGAERYYDIGSVLNETVRDPRTEAHVLMGCTQLAAARGEMPVALARLEEAMALRPRISATVSRAALDALVVATRLQNGQVEAAAEWLGAYPLAPDLVPRSVPFFLAQLSRARLALARGDREHAQNILQDVEQTALGAGHGRQVLTAQILASIAHYARQDTGEALRVLERALALAASEGYVRAFVDEGEPIRQLLTEYVRRAPTGSLRTFGNRLLAAFSLPLAPKAIPAEALVEPLSDREIQVLEWVARGASNREIAGALIISPNTVKKHTINLFGKLGVNSRTQALVRAREIGLLA